METRLGQAAPLVVAMEAILAACPLVADMDAVAEGPCVGPLTPGHAQMKPQPPSQPRRASGSCGLSCPVCLALEGVPVLYCPVCLALEGFPVLFVLSV